MCSLGLWGAIKVAADDTRRGVVSGLKFELGGFRSVSMASTPKKRKIEPKRNNPSQPLTDKVATSFHHSMIPVTPVVKLDFMVQQAKKFAVIQAQQERCLGSYRSFDSPYGNYLVPVIPTHADLFGGENAVVAEK